ncbi:MAG: FkbM family methyltransferase, partial [Gammaproteobacteria bacterium]|nr:FkbM family methyltransferase [Gammaproteobacteria bacterium]
QSLGVNVTQFIDRDPNKTGTMIHQVPVMLPEPAILAGVSAMLIASRHVVKQVQSEMQSYPFPMMSFDGYFVVKNYDRLAKVRDNYLNDHKSVETFNALLIAMLTGSLDSCRAVMEKDMYFGLPEFTGNFDETFVDAGAFTGDTVERFIWENLGTFRHIYAFEPGYKQFAAMEKRMDRLVEEWAFSPDKVSLVKAGLSSSSGRMSCTFVNDDPLRHGLTETADQADNDDERYSSAVCTLDEYLDGKPVSFIKADVEGMEMPLLAGAQETIKRYKPKMALCVYHYPSDLYEIAEYVRNLVPGYQFQLRQHAPIFGDFVLYCHVE